MRLFLEATKKMKKHLVLIATILLLSTIIISGCEEQKTPTIISFVISPNEIELGQSCDIRWIVTDATSVSIDHGIGFVNLSGNRTITPMQTTMYTITAISPTKTLTATAQVTVNEPYVKPNVSMLQSEFYIEIIQIENSRVQQSLVSLIAINKNNSENQTAILRPTIVEGDGNKNYLAAGDVIIFQNLSEFPVKQLWDIILYYRGDVIGQIIFRNPPGPYDSPRVRVAQFGSNVTIIGIINGPINQTQISVVAINKTSGAIQSSIIGPSIIDNDNNQNILSIDDWITFSNLAKFKANDQWTIQLKYGDDVIGQCTFTNPKIINIIPT